MSNRLTKQQMKTDQLQHALTDARDYVAAHRSETTRWALIAGGAVLILGAIWGGIVLRNGRLAARVSSALALFDDPFASASPRTAGVAAVAAIDAEAAAGRPKEALETAKRYLEASDSPVSKDVLVFTMARLYEQTGQNVEAKSFYQRLVTDFPDSPLRTDGQQKLASLDRKSTRL